MSKYDRLTAYLSTLTTEEWRASFAEIEEILGFSLPASAYEHPAWWANQTGGNGQSSAWQDAGWKTEGLDLGGTSVTFVRQFRNFLGEIASRSSSSNAPFLSGLARPTAKQGSGFLSNIANPVRPITIAEAKAGLAAQFAVPEDNIEIRIRY